MASDGRDSQAEAAVIRGISSTGSLLATDEQVDTDIDSLPHNQPGSSLSLSSMAACRRRGHACDQVCEAAHAGVLQCFPTMD